MKNFIYWIIAIVLHPTFYLCISALNFASILWSTHPESRWVNALLGIVVFGLYVDMLFDKHLNSAFIIKVKKPEGSIDA